MHFFRRQIVFVAPFLAAIAFGQPTAQNTFAIVGAKVEVGDGTSIAEATVLVKEGRIVAVQSGSVNPAGYTVIDGKGKVLFPGFIDGFSSRGLKSPAAQTLAARPDVGVTAHGTMYLANRKGITPEWKASENLDLSPDEATYKQGFTSALLSGTRGAMRGQAAFTDLLPDTVKSRVLLADAGASMSFRTGAGAGYPSNILGSIALLRQTLYDAKSVSEGAELYSATPKKPDWAAAIEALIPVVKGQQPVFFEANFAREVDRVMTLASEFGFRPIIVGGRDSGLLAETLAQKNIPVILNADLGTEPPMTTSASVPASDRVPDEVRKERNDRWQIQSKSDQSLAKAGVLFAFSSEGGFSGMLGNVRKRIKRGLSREDALKALTSNAAKIFGLADETGTIAAGKRANLVLMNGDFAEDSSEVTLVSVDGRLVFVQKVDKS